MESTPDAFRCSITFEVMRDPVMLGSSGHTFERSAIEDWLQNNHTNPLTNVPLTPIERRLIPNIALRDAIDQYIESIAGRIISPRDINLGELLGQGADKDVYRATLSNQSVAVQRIRDMSFTEAEAQKFVRLGCHPHLLRFLGRTIVGNTTNAQPNALVTELAPLGDLQSFITTMSDRNEALSDIQAVTILEQVADGMAMVHAAGIIHRDLAARNVMVFELDSSDPTKTLVKVSDYGLSTMLDSGRAYLVTGGGSKTPIRWMAPESIRRRQWSSHSDIWAFGVLLWEVLSGGEYPYGFVGSDEDVARRVCDGSLRLERPAGCSDELWDIFQSCCSADRTVRPTFVALRILLQNIRTRISQPQVSLPYPIVSVK
jgi:Eph receptor A1